MKFPDFHNNLFHKVMLVFTNCNFVHFLKMTFKPITFVVFLQLMLAIHVYASSPAEISFNKKANITFRFAPNDNNSLKNYYVKEIARLNFLNLYETYFSIDLEFRGKIFENDNGGYTMKFGVYNPLFSGDFYYRGFDLSEVMVPAKYDLDILINNPEYTDTVHFTRIQPNRHWITLFDSTSLSLINETDFTLIQLEPHFYSDAKSAFENRIAQINRYLAYTELLAMNLEKAKAINPETRDSMLPVYMQIYDLKRFEDLLSQLDVNFPIPDDHQAEMLANQKNLNSQLRKLQTLFFQNPKTIKPIFAKSTYEDAANTLIEIQRSYLQQMGASNHLFEPGYIEVADMFHDNSGWDHLSLKLVEEVFPDAGSATDELDTFATVLYRHYSAICDTLIAHENFNEAGIFAISAQTFCNANPDENCDILTFNKIAQTRYGIYDAYLHVAAKAMENENPDFGYKYLEMAGDFQEKYSSFIISRVAIERGFEELAWHYFDLANAHYDDAEYKQALQKFVNAQDIYHKIGQAQYLDLIDKKIGKCMKTIEEMTNHEEENLKN